MDINDLAYLEPKPADVPSSLHFVEKFVETYWGSEINLEFSQSTLDRKLQKPTTESLQALGQVLHVFGDQLSSNDVVRVTIVLLNTIKYPNLFQSNASLPTQYTGCQLKTTDLEAQRLVFNALTNLLAQSISLIPMDIWLLIVKTMRDVLELIACEGKLVVDWKYSRFYSGVLRCVQLALLDNKGPIGEYVAGLVTSLLCFSGYGLSAGHFMGQSMQESVEVFPEVETKEVLATKAVYKPPHLRRMSGKNTTQNAANSSENHQSKFKGERRLFQSDSEHSDSDGSAGNQDRFKCSKARALAILSIQALARAEPKALHGHWILLFPTHDIMNVRRLQNSLLKTLLYDPILKVRMAAAATISLMFEGPSQAFIRMAEYREVSKTGSFLTLSCSLGQCLLQLQKGLTHLAINETNLGLLVASLKALSLFVGAAPFSRLPKELLPNVIKAVQKRIKSLVSLSTDQHLNAVCMALNCIGCALNTVPPSDQVAQMLWEEGCEINRENQLLRDILDCVQPRMPSLVCVEALQALKFAIHNYPSIKIPFWTFIYPIKFGILKMNTAQCLGGDPNPGSLHCFEEKVVHAATKLLNEFLRAVSGSSFTDDLQDEVLHQSSFALQSTHQFSMVPVVRSPIIPECESRSELFEVSCWDESLQDYLPFLLAHPSALVRAEAMNCFAGLTFVVFCNLPEQKRSYIISKVLEMAVKDESPSVRSTACRAIGVLVNFPALTARTDALTSAMDVIMHSTKDSSLAVRVTASWALANFCDALRCASEKSNDMLASLSFTSLAECAVRLSKDSDKVRANAVRALGNLTRVIKFDAEDANATTLVAHNKQLLQSKRLQLEFLDKISWLERVVQTFVSCVTTGNVKVQWNVCHALGNLFLNKSLAISEMTWATSVFSILLLLLRDSKNFKIRIQAASALAVPETRRDYGESFSDVLQALVRALDSLNSNELLAPSTFKYMHALSEQLTDTCLHVLGLAEPPDYEQLQDFVIKRESFLEAWLRSTFSAASQELTNGGCQCIENEGSEGTSTSHLSRCWVHKEKLLMPPRERIWYALNEREPLLSNEECLLRRREDVRRVARKLVEMYTHGNQTKLVISPEQFLMRFSS